MTISDTKNHPGERKGAPLKFLIIFAACWISVRVLWEAYIVVPVPKKFVPLLAVPHKIFETKNIGSDFWDYGNSRSILKQRTAFSIERKSQEAKKHLTSFLKNLPKKTDHLINRPSDRVRLDKSAGKLDNIILGSSITNVKLDARQMNETSTLESPGHHKLSKRRLSGYFWAFARQNRGASLRTITLASAPGAQYGASQTGAIISYRLNDSSSHKAWLYGRVTTSLSLQNAAVAGGVRYQPIKDIPVSLSLERRSGAQENGGNGTAIFAAASLDPRKIAGKIELSGYAQAGYVTAREDTYFFDLSATANRSIFDDDRKKVEVGAGLWSGGQTGVARLDIGPQISVTLPITQRNKARFQLDWRQKIAGNAAPDSGLALTITTGF